MAATLREHPPHPIYSAHIWDLKKFITSLLKRKEHQKNPQTFKVPSQPISVKPGIRFHFSEHIHYLNWRWVSGGKKKKNPPLYSFTKKLFTKLSKKAFATTQDWSFYFKCKTLVWKGSTAEGLYKFFLLLFSISFAYASQNYKILVGEMQKARFHIPKRSISMCCIWASWPPRKARQTHFGPPVLQLLTSSPSLSGLCPVFPMRNKHQAWQAAKPVAASPRSLPWNSTDEQTCTSSSWEVVPSAKIFLINWPQERK